MEEMYLDDFKQKAKENPEGLMFEIKCKKCQSKNVIIDGFDEISQGSEYTGVWGDSGVIIKCLSCGNAYKVIITSM